MLVADGKRRSGAVAAGDTDARRRRRGCCGLGECALLRAPLCAFPAPARGLASPHRIPAWRGLGERLRWGGERGSGAAEKRGLQKDERPRLRRPRPPSPRGLARNPASTRPSPASTTIGVAGVRSLLQERQRPREGFWAARASPLFEPFSLSPMRPRWARGRRADPRTDLILLAPDNLGGGALEGARLGSKKKRGAAAECVRARREWGFGWGGAILVED